MGVCTAFVFAALVEFTCVNYLWRMQDSPRFEASNKLKVKEEQNLLEMHLVRRQTRRALCGISDDQISV
jgi:hypothetical protein